MILSLKFGTDSNVEFVQPAEVLSFRALRHSSWMNMVD